MNKNRSHIMSFAVRDLNGETLVETDFPRLTAERVARRAQIRRIDDDDDHRRAQAAAIIASLKQRRPMATPRPMATRQPARLNATRSALLVAGALAVAALVLWWAP